MKESRNNEKKNGGPTRRSRGPLLWWKTRSQKFKFVALLALLLLSMMLYSLLDSLFGFGTLKGGRLGQYLDGRIRRYNIAGIIQKRTEGLAEMGIQLPHLDIRNNRFIKETPSPFGQLAAIMNLTTHNEKNMAKAEALAEQWKKRCKHSSPPLTIPRQILQPNIGNWYRKLCISNFTSIGFNGGDMIVFMKTHFPQLFEKIVSIKDEAKQVQVFSLCSLYWFGGYTFGSFVNNAATLVDDVAESIDHWHPCIDRAILYVSQPSDGKNSPAIAMLAATPRLPSLLCLIEKLAATNIEDIPDLNHMVLRFLDTDTQNVRGITLQEPAANITVYINRCPEHTQSTSCAIQGKTHSEFNDASPTDCQERWMLRIPDVFSQNSDLMEMAKLPFKVDIIQDEVEDKLIDNSKLPIGEYLKRQHAWPSWLCNRCLRTMMYGSFQACSFACNKLYIESQCRDHEDKKSKNVATMHTQNFGILGTAEKRIPKIIHQTWHSDITVDKYPELARIQNGWRSSGFDYRFYNDTEARSYIEKNYPSFVVDCYDALLPRAFKADLFRLLVLLKDGGVYADIDIQLETSLSSFITSDMSLFIPGETIKDLAGADYCLWNGFIGSAPGHPVIAKAVERLLESISTRADLFDIERYACRLDGPATPIWKVRALTTLILSGPCALGMAMNEVLGRNLLSDFHSGWAPNVHKQGDLDLGSMLILLADKRDMGYFRFSDIERNLLVASTNMPDLSKKSLLVDSRPDRTPRIQPHYSELPDMADVFGTEGVYVDKKTTDLQINIKHSNTMS